MRASLNTLALYFRKKIADYIIRERKNLYTTGKTEPSAQFFLGGKLMEKGDAECLNGWRTEGMKVERGLRK